MSATTSRQALPVTEGRDANGRFAKGNNFGRGNPFARQVAQLRKEMLGMVMDGPYFKEIVMQLQQLAAGGNVIAIKLLFQYLFGKPTEGVDPDWLDIEEWKIHTGAGRTVPNRVGVDELAQNGSAAGIG